MDEATLFFIVIKKKGMIMKEPKPINKSLQCFFVKFVIGLFITSILILFANIAEVNNESIFMGGVLLSVVWGMLSLMRNLD